MGNTGLLRCEAEMTHLQPQLGETRRQELRNSQFWHSLLFKSQLVKEEEDFLLEASPFVVPTIRKEAITPHKAVTNHLLQVGGNQISEAPGVLFDPTLGSEGVKPLFPMTP